MLSPIGSIGSSLLIIAIVSAFESTLEAKPRLKLVLIVHRHGDRTPDFLYPLSPYRGDQYWPDGYEMLTIRGKQRMYSLGQYVRKRYKNYLTDNPREVYIRSSGKNRCLQSTSLLMAGLYPPKGRWKWNNDLGRVWQPFPINTVQYSEDGMLNTHSKCPKAEKENKKISGLKCVKQLERKHENLLNFISKKSGLDLDYSSAGNLFNTLDIERANGYSLPDWVNQSVIDCLNEFHEMIFVFESMTRTQLRLRTGLLLEDISDRLRQRTRDQNLKYKLFIYSTHDTQLAVLLNALGAFNNRSIPFGATLFLELYDSPDNSDKLELHYLNVTESEKTYELSLTKCIAGKKDDLCLLNRFFDSIASLIPKDWRSECKL